MKIRKIQLGNGKVWSTDFYSTPYKKVMNFRGMTILSIALLYYQELLIRWGIKKI